MELKELPKCPVETTLKLIGEKWKILIIRINHWKLLELL